MIRIGFDNAVKYQDSGPAFLSYVIRDNWLLQVREGEAGYTDSRLRPVAWQESDSDVVEFTYSANSRSFPNVTVSRRIRPLRWNSSWLSSFGSPSCDSCSSSPLSRMTVRVASDTSASL